MKKNMFFVMSVLMVVTIILTACGTPATTAAPAPATQAPAAPATEVPAAPAATAVPAKAANPGLAMDQAKVAAQFFTDADYQASMDQMKMAPLNPSDPVYLQYLVSNPTDITKFPQYAAFAAKKAPYNVCFSNAGVNNPWRVVGYIDMREQVEQLRTQGLVKNFYHLDAQGNDAKQIADIQDIINTPGKCYILIVASNTSDALTPMVEKACAVMPVVQFDRFAQTDCPVVSERTIGGYAFGITGAQFVVDKLGAKGGNVLAFRILPGVDVLEQRWGAARKIFEANPQINVIGVEFVGYDSFKASTVVSDYLTKYGKIDAVWMDAGGTAVTILEAFKDAGAPYPIMVGEDQEDYLQYWKTNNLTAISPSFPTFQWRTAVLAAVMFLQGKTVQHHWTMPQLEITQDNLDKYINTTMPPLHYALCGCEDMTNYPAAWQKPDINKYKDVP